MINNDYHSVHLCLFVAILDYTENKGHGRYRAMSKGGTGWYPAHYSVGFTRAWAVLWYSRGSTLFYLQAVR